MADVDGRDEEARESTTVASQIRVRPLSHGISVRPSGLFPSALLRPGGSLTVGIPARVRPRQIKSLRLACLATLPGPREQQSPWAPLALTIDPHRHSWGSQIFMPSLRPTATLTASSSSLKPQAAMGSEKSQSLACGAPPALSLALL